MSAASSRQLAFTAPKQAAVDAARAQRIALGSTKPAPREDTSLITMATITPICGRKEGK